MTTEQHRGSNSDRSVQELTFPEQMLAASPGEEPSSWTRSLDLDTLAKRYGSPLYITHLDQLRRNLAKFVWLVGQPDRVAYPVKANPSLAVLKELASLGCSADCASSREVELALSSGFPITRVVYNSPAPDRALMAGLLSSGGCVVADSEMILTDLAAELEPSQCKGRLLVRVNPEQPVEYLHRSDWHDLVAHASPTSKFGVPSEDLVGVLARCSLPVSGLHLHVGTQMDAIAPFVAALDFLHGLKDQVEALTPHRVEILDLGGGLGIPFADSRQFPTIAEYVKSLRGRMRPDATYVVEPGHSLVGDAVALLASIRELKSMRGRRWAILDVGSDQLIKVTLLSWHHAVFDRHHHRLANEGPDAIGGPLCFAGDTLLPATDLSGQAKGDPLLIEKAGAYCFALANHFNGYLGPAHVAMDDSGESYYAYLPEDGFSDHVIQGYCPASAGARLCPSPPHPVDPVLIERLSSCYLRRDSAADRYDFIETVQLAPGCLEFRVDVCSTLGAVSMPLAVRIVSDATIVAALYFSGKSEKNVSVWGTRLQMNSDTMIRLKGPLTIVVQIAPDASLPASRRTSQLAYWQINGGQFRGTLRFIF